MQELNEDIEHCLNINLRWEITKKWWEEINNEPNNDTNKETNKIFPSTYNVIALEEKDIFSIKAQYCIKKIFEIDDLSNINNNNNNNNNNNKINLKNYDILKLVQNAFENKNLINLFIEDDRELKKIINYIIQFQPYFRRIKKKIINILKIIFKEEYFHYLFKVDDDLTKVIAPIAGTMFYLYLNSGNIELTIENTLLLDDTYIIFFIVSYLIVDNFMDEVDNNNEEKVLKKKIFFKWFINIVNNPGEPVELLKDEESIWQCVIFRKYFIIFHKKYPSDDIKNKIIYDFVKVMIHNLNLANKIQKSEKSSPEQILEASFKKSYVVSFFMALLINIQLNLTVNLDNLNNICKMLFLVQLYDDYFDIDKDIDENNYTYFNEFYNGISHGNENNYNINKKVAKLVKSSFVFLEDLNEKNININRILHYSLKNVLFLLFNFHKNKLNPELLNYFLSYSIFTDDLLNYFNTKSYNQFEDTIIIQAIRILLERIEE
jgi:hypothetical protein